MDCLEALQRMEIELALKQRQLDIDRQKFELSERLAALRTVAKTSASALPKDLDASSRLEREQSLVSSSLAINSASQDKTIVDLTIDDDSKIESDDDDVRLPVMKRKRLSPESEVGDSHVETRRTVRLMEQQKLSDQDRRARAQAEASCTPTTAADTVDHEAIPQRDSERIIKFETGTARSRIVTLKIPTSSQQTHKAFFPFQGPEYNYSPRTGLNTPPPKNLGRRSPASRSESSPQDELSSTTIRSHLRKQRSRRKHRIRPRRTITVTDELRELEEERRELLSYPAPRLSKRSRPPSGTYNLDPRLTDQELLTMFCQQIIAFVLENARVPGDQTTIAVQPYIVRSVMQVTKYKSIEEFLNHVRLLLMESDNNKKREKKSKRSDPERKIKLQIERLREMWVEFNEYGGVMGEATHISDMYAPL